MSTAMTGWELLHSPLPREALKPLSRSVYGVSGLTDVNEGFLIERLWQSRLSWSWEVRNLSYCGTDVRTVKPLEGSPYEVTYFMATVEGVLTIDGHAFGGAGAHDNRKIDAAAKGAATVAFKNACKLAGLTTELYKGGQMRDVVDRDDPDEATTKPSSSNGHPDVPTGEQVAQLIRLAAALPKTPKDSAWVDSQLAQFTQTSVLRALLHQHRGQCGEDCEHVKSQPSLLPETAEVGTT